MLQLYGFASFREFDYGLPLNFLMYNQTVPPKYNLFAIEVDVINFYGEKDILVDYKVTPLANTMTFCSKPAAFFEFFGKISSAF